MTGWIIFFALLAGIYVFIILNYLKGWRSLPGWEIPPAFAPQTRVSVLIPARNEALHIARCLESVLNQTYPASLFEVIVLDDHSEDDTFHIVEEISRRQPQVKILRLADFVKSGETQSFKKKALEIGIGQASGELIVTTDADCIAPPEWLMLLVSLFEKNNPVFIAAPLGFHKGKNLLQRFQSLDMLGMMAVTGAGIHHRLNYLCNGANLAYPKVVFQQVNGFEGIDKLASGDDMLLLQKIAGRYPERIEFLKNRRATVLTTAMPDVRSFFSQRLRWASKSASYSDRRVTLILGLVFFLLLGYYCELPFFSVPGMAGRRFCRWIISGKRTDRLFFSAGNDCLFQAERFDEKLHFVTIFAPCLHLHRRPAGQPHQELFLERQAGEMRAE